LHKKKSTPPVMQEQGPINAAAPETADFRLKTLDFGLPSSVVRPESDRLRGNPGGVAHTAISGVLMVSRRKKLNRLELASLMEVSKVSTYTGPLGS
jgi:hypothetical protein